MPLYKWLPVLLATTALSISALAQSTTPSTAPPEQLQPATLPGLAQPATPPVTPGTPPQSAQTGAPPASRPPEPNPARPTVHPAPPAHPASAPGTAEKPLLPAETGQHTYQLDFMSMVFVFMLATFIGIGVIRRVSRLLHTPLMSLTNAISAIAVVGSILVAGSGHYGWGIRLLGSIALFCSMTNIISGFLITDRMLKMFKTPPRQGGQP